METWKRLAGLDLRQNDANPKMAVNININDVEYPKKSRTVKVAKDRLYFSINREWIIVSRIDTAK